MSRILDYRQDADGTGLYQWVYDSDGKAKPANPNNPRTLSGREIRESLQASGEDFLFIKWRPNIDNPDRPMFKNPYRRAYDFIPTFYEVINCPTDDLEGLRKNLKSGWPYSGKPTQQVLVLYSREKESCNVVLLNRTDLDFSDNHIRLKPNAPLGAEQYSIREQDIKYLPDSRFGEKNKRLIYTKPLLPTTKTVVLIQFLKQYALQYMRWYLNKVCFVESGFDRKTFENMLIEAVQSPNTLNEFGISLTPSNIRTLQRSVLRLVDNDKQVKALINDALTNNPTFKQLCIDTCRRETQRDLDKERAAMKAELEADSVAQRQEIETQIQQKQAEVQRLEELVSSRSESYERLKKLVDPLQAQVDDMNRQLERAKTNLKQVNDQAEKDLAEFEHLKEEELRKLEEQREATLSQLEDDVALKLGLNTVVRSLETALSALPSKTVTDTAAAPTMQALDYPAVPVQHGKENFAATLADNLQAFGVVSVNDSSASPRALANACERALSITRLIAVDSTFAAPLANALSYAGNGRPAKHASIPADWHDALALDGILSNEDTDVLVLDGPIDTVNESLLFALSRLDLDATVILPIGAYGNLRLIAGEIWDHVFYLPTEWYIKLPLTPERLTRSSKNRKTTPLAKQKIVSALTGLHKQSANVPHSSLVLPASISAQFEELETGEAWIAPHLALRADAGFGTDTPKSSLIADSEAAKRLMERIGRSRHVG